MKILVCIKQVVDMESPLNLKAGDLCLHESDALVYRMNRYDDYALEEALLLKERIAGVELHVVSIGPDRVTEVIKRALSKGADQGLHIRCVKAPLSALETATFIADYARDKAFTLILAGVMSEDSMQCQVGPLVAALLDLPCAVSVTALNYLAGERCITVASELEGLLSEKVVVALPAVLTIQTSEHTPRYPVLSKILRAKKMIIPTLDAGEMPAIRPREEFLPLAYPDVATKGQILHGTRDEKAEQLLNILHDRSLL